MIRSLTPRVHVYGIISIAALLGGVALGRPELVALGTPLALGLMAGLLGGHHVELTVETHAERGRALEGDLLELAVLLRSNRSVARLEVTPDLPAGLRLHHVEVDDRGPQVRLERDRILIGLVGGRQRRVRVYVECRRWGGYPTIDLEIGASDLLGVFRYSARHTSEVFLKVFPHAEDLRRLLAPLDTQLSVGELLSRQRGPGIEFSELRPFASGDDLRRVNWRASARRDQLWINERHPDHNGDVVLLVDTPTGRGDLEALALDYTVRAVASLARGHLGRRDRVGLIVFGGVLRWLRPTTLAEQRYQILDALADSRHRGGDLAVTALPYRALPAKSLVIGLSPLLDPESIAAFVELRGRGTDLAIVEVDTSRYLPAADTPERLLARRIWELERDRVRRRFRRRGVAVVEWDPGQPFMTVLEEVASFRRAVSHR